jgi:aspartyl-tRNA(Asn)/glutamyl-tRNA(Gln) amidotransferase subunit A
VEVPDYSAALTGDIKGMRIGVPEEYWVEGTQPEVVQAIRADIEVLRELGAEIKPVSLPHTKYGVAAYYIIAPAEASANLARYDGVKYGYSYHDTDNMWKAMELTRGHGFGPEVKRRIMLGTYALSAGYYDAYYKRAEKVRTLITEDFERVFQDCDALVSPASPTVAFKIGEISDPYQMYLQDVFTIPANLAGICGVSVPGGFGHGLPIGLQLLGNAFAESNILRIADAFERVTDYHKQWPQNL